MKLGGLKFFSRNSAGALGLIAYHPRDCLTWHWGVTVEKTRRERWSKSFCFATRRTSQWHDYIRLPFGYDLVIGYQDYHKAPKATREIVRS